MQMGVSLDDFALKNAESFALLDYTLHALMNTDPVKYNVLARLSHLLDEPS